MIDKQGISLASLLIKSTRGTDKDDSNGLCDLRIRFNLVLYDSFNSFLLLCQSEWWQLGTLIVKSILKQSKSENSFSNEDCACPLKHLFLTNHFEVVCDWDMLEPRWANLNGGRGTMCRTESLNLKWMHDTNDVSC